MSMYRKEWSCCGDVTETNAWEPESCPFCTPAVSLAQPGEGALTGWTKPEEGLPELGVEVLVWSKEPWEKEPSMKFDTWDEQHEAPLSFSTQTIPIGPGWNNHDDFYSVIAWMPLPPPPGITSTPTGDSNG